MVTYEIPLVPGPTRVPEPVRQAYLTDHASATSNPSTAGCTRAYKSSCAPCSVRGIGWRS